MQLIEHELKRWDLWKEQAKDLNETAQRKWDFAMKKQDQLIAGLNLKQFIRKCAGTKFAR